MKQAVEKQPMHVLVVDDDSNMRLAVSETLKREGYAVTAASDGKEGYRRVSTQPFSLVITDVKMPRIGGLEFLQEVKKSHPGLPVVVMTGYGTIQNAVQAMKFGASDYLVKPFELEHLIEAVGRNVDHGLPDDPDELCRIPGGTGNKSIILTRDKETLNLLKVARNIAVSEATVMLRGESGTGKELFAYYIHKNSRRAKKEFVAVNCAAIPENLLESELFGHEKGAFTGAIQAAKGKFEIADGGTILLDEISEMDAHLQAKLLRVIQEREIERVGRNLTIPIDIRIIATTNRDLEKEVAEGRFREDLFYRLNVIPLTLPTLKERSGDVQVLAEYFIDKFRIKNGKEACRLSPAALEKLSSYSWPGNVRELQNTIERSVLMTDGQVIEPKNLLLGACRDDQEVATALPVAPVGQSLKDMERELIMSTLQEYEGNRTRTAKILKISIRTLRNKLNEYRQEGIFIDDRP